MLTAGWSKQNIVLYIVCTYVYKRVYITRIYEYSLGQLNNSFYLCGSGQLLYTQSVYIFDLFFPAKMLIIGLAVPGGRTLP